MSRRILLAAAAVCGCMTPYVPEDSSTGASADPSGSSTSGTTGGADPTGPTTGGDAPGETAQIVHSFGSVLMSPYLETEPCVQWTLDNDEPLYVNAVTLVNDGGFHHSNWFVVPEDVFAGDDGYWNCWDREFNEISAAVEGTVLTAQSTQSRHEVMRLPEGVVVKVPPRHKVVAQVHLLNLGSTDLDSELRIALGLIHPRDVDVVVAPMHLDYRQLDILAQERTRFTGNCRFGQAYEGATKKPLDLKLYYVLPHYHYLGEYFNLEILGGPRDGEVLFRLDGFNGDANGKAFDPPVDLSGADGLRFGCGYNNWRDKDIHYGIGDNEMCAMLGLADSRVMIESRVVAGSQAVGIDGGVILNEADCDNYAIYKNPAQAPPTEEEKGRPLYVPPSDPGDVDLDPVKPCVDSDPAATADEPATLTSVRDAIFTPSCTFSSCHDTSTPAAGLDLQTAAGLHQRLIGHQATANTELTLVKPGDPDNSWLYQLASRCDPQDATGAPVKHMPFNAPTLLPDPLVAKLRAWIAAGALDN